MPGSTLPALLDMVQRGKLDASLARRLIVHIEPHARNAWMHRSHRRTFEEVQTLLNEAPNPAADTSLSRTKTTDALDQLIDLFWEPDVLPSEKGAQSPEEQFFAGLMETLNHDATGERLRAVVSILVVASRRGFWPTPALDTCLAFWPTLLQFPWVPRSERREAIRVFYRLGSQCRREPADTIQSLIKGFCYRPNETVDLWAIGGLLHLLESLPYKFLQRWIPLAKIISSFWEDPESSVSFLCLPDNSETGRAFLLKAICKHHRPEQFTLLAWMIHSIPADGYEFLEDLAGMEAAGVALSLLELAESEGKILSDNKTRVASEWLARRILTGGSPAILEFLNGWLKAKEPEQFSLGLAILGLVAEELPIEILKEILFSFRDRDLRTLVKLIGWCSGFPYGKERQLAEVCLDHPDWEIRRWALRCCPEEAGDSLPPKIARTIPRSVHQLTDKQIARIATCGESALANALKPALENPSRGLCAALSRRPDPAASQVEVCAALLASHDSLRLVNQQFERFAELGNPDFIERLECSMVAHWNRRQELPMIGHAWLYRWECHAFAFAELAERHSDGWEGQMRYAMNASGPFLMERIWQAVARVVALLRYRDKPRLIAQWTKCFAELAVESLGTPWGLPAATALIHALRAGMDPEGFELLKPAVVARLPEMSPEERETLRPWVSSLGVAHLPVEARPVKGTADENILAKIASSNDFDQLETWCFDKNTKIADEAALRLLEFEEPGAARLLKILSGDPLPPSALLLAETVSLWPEGESLHGAGDLVNDKTRPLPLRFLIGLQLLERGQLELADAVLELINADTLTAWFQQSDWNRLLKAGLTMPRLCLTLPASPHPQAYLPALTWLLANDEAGEEEMTAVRRFLEAGSERLFELRVQAAEWLLDRGDRSGFPILVQSAAQSGSGKNPFLGANSQEINAAVSSALLAGGSLFPEERLFDLIKDGVDDPWLLQQAFEPMLSRCLSDSVRQAIVPRVQKTASRSLKLRRVAEEFAWGIRMGRELTGRLFTIEMIGGEDLGYTRLQENRIHISPMPILRSERNARDVVRGLILHEYGHHMYHRGEEPERLWEQAHNEGVGRLLNLVSDEHLERNLRALDDSFGDRLKRLVAYAFQHSKKEMPVVDLLTTLGGRAFEVLTGTKLQVARRRGCVIVDNGQILLEMERSGLSFARFMRALRMGLGNRHEDSKVQAGLDLFRGKFRKSSMADMLIIAKRLREIFGWECGLLDSFSQEECLRGDPSDLEAHGEGITNQEVQSEIQRINNPRKSREKIGEGKGGTRWINVSEEEKFETISTVVPMAFDRNQHAPYAQQVARPARQLRQYLKDLGLAMVQHRMRTSGRILDQHANPGGRVAERSPHAHRPAEKDAQRPFLGGGH